MCIKHQALWLPLAKLLDGRLSRVKLRTQPITQRAVVIAAKVFQKN